MLISGSFRLKPPNVSNLTSILMALIKAIEGGEAMPSLSCLFLVKGENSFV